MTHNEILSLKPGPELDALVAEKVMGWKWSAKSTPGGYWSPEKQRTQMIWGSKLHAARKGMGITDDAIGDGFVWSPSTDIAAAMEVVDTVQTREPGWRFSLLGGDASFRRDWGGAWQAEFFGHLDPKQDYGQRHGSAYGVSSAEAICKAALLALEAKP